MNTNTLIFRKSHNQHTGHSSKCLLDSFDHYLLGGL